MKKVILALLLVFYCLAGKAQYHLLDSSFGLSGSAAFLFGNQARLLYDAAVLPDGHVYCAGEYLATSYASYPFVARLLPNGQLDPSFATTGAMIDSTVAVYAGLTSMGLQSTGKVVAGGWGKDCHPVWSCSTVFTLLRYDVNGVRDTTFGDSGVVQTYPSDGGGNILDIAILPDDRILAVGMFGVSGPGSMNVNLARYLPDGDLDSTFGSNGLVFWAAGNGNDFARSVVIDPDGKIVIAGYRTQDGERDALIARFHPDGSLDSSSGGGDGWSILPIPNAEDEFMALAALPGGGYFATGQTDPATGNYMQLDAWFTHDGNLDLQYASGTGYIAAQLWNAPYVATSGRGCFAQPDGKVVVAGYFVPSTVSGHLMRYDQSGNRDLTFHPAGADTLFPDMLSVQFLGLTSAPSGHIVAVGNRQPMFTTNFEFLVARFFNPDMMVGASTTTFAAGIEVFPNPSQGRFAIVSKHGEIQEAFLMDLRGRRIANLYPVGISQWQLETPQAEAGTYFVVVKTAAGETVAQKVLITRD